MKFFIFIISIFFAPEYLIAAKYIDFTSGNDRNDGTKEFPLKTLDNTNWSYKNINGDRISWDDDDTWLLNSCSEHEFSGNVRASGTNKNQLTISTYNNCEKATINIKNGYAGFIIDNKKYITINNINFTSMNENFGEGIRIINSKNILINNCSFKGIKGNQRGIHIIGNSVDCSINQCLFKRLQTGIITKEHHGLVPKRLKILNSQFLDINNGDTTGADGIAFGLTQNRLSYDFNFAIIDSNQFINISDQAIDLIAANNVIISNNYIDCKVNNDKGDGDGIKLGIDKPITYGIYIYNNFITNVKNDFIYAGASSFFLINNTFNNAGRHCITNSQNINKKSIILNNIFSNIGLINSDSLYINNFTYTNKEIDNNLYYSIKTVNITNNIKDWNTYKKLYNVDSNSIFNINPNIDSDTNLLDTFRAKHKGKLLFLSDTAIYKNDILKKIIIPREYIGCKLPPFIIKLNNSD